MVKLQQSQNISILINHFDYGQKAYMSFTLPCGFCYRFAAFKNAAEAKEINQAFPEVFANYAAIYFHRKYQKELSFEIHRNAISFTDTANLENIKKDIEWIHSVLFYLPPDEEIFKQAKAKTISSMKERYAKIQYRALYKMLEFSEGGKGFNVTKLTDDITKIDYAAFCKYLACFIQPQNCVLFISGNMESLDSELSLQKRQANTGVPILCFQNRVLNYGTDCHVIKPDIADYSMGCIKFSFKGQGITLAEQYFLMAVIADLLFSTGYSINADAADSSIIYWNHRIAEYKYQFVNLLKTSEIHQSSAKLLYSLYYMQTKEPLKFLSLWSCLLMNGINMNDYIHLLEICSRQSVWELFTKADPIVYEGQVILRVEDTYEPSDDQTGRIGERGKELRNSL